MSLILGQNARSPLAYATWTNVSTFFQHQTIPNSLIRNAVFQMVSKIDRHNFKSAVASWRWDSSTANAEAMQFGGQLSIATSDGT